MRDGDPAAGLNCGVVANLIELLATDSKKYHGFAADVVNKTLLGGPEDRTLAPGLAYEIASAFSVEGLNHPKEAAGNFARDDDNNISGYAAPGECDMYGIFEDGDGKPVAVAGEVSVNTKDTSKLREDLEGAFRHAADLKKNKAGADSICYVVIVHKNIPHTAAAGKVLREYFAAGADDNIRPILLTMGVHRDLCLRARRYANEEGVSPFKRMSSPEVLKMLEGFHSQMGLFVDGRINQKREGEYSDELLGVAQKAINALLFREAPAKSAREPQGRDDDDTGR